MRTHVWMASATILPIYVTKHLRRFISFRAFSTRNLFECVFCACKGSDCTPNASQLATEIPVFVGGIYETRWNKMRTQRVCEWICSWCFFCCCANILTHIFTPKIFARITNATRNVRDFLCSFCSSTSEVMKWHGTHAVREYMWNASLNQCTCWRCTCCISWFIAWRLAFFFFFSFSDEIRFFSPSN